MIGQVFFLIPMLRMRMHAERLDLAKLTPKPDVAFNARIRVEPGIHGKRTKISADTLNPIPTHAASQEYPA